MSPRLAKSDQSVVVVVDLQPTFLAAIWESDRVVRRAEFLLQVARVLGIPSVATVQNQVRMGGLHENIGPLVQNGATNKMPFSCCGAPGFVEGLASLQRSQAILVGIETHICVNQTACDLLDRGMAVFVAADAVSASSQDRHHLGLERMRANGVTLAHSEAISYEWLGTADHPSFREVLQLVKGY